MELFFLLESSPLLYTLTVALLGLLIGSFLNVVIYRFPIMLERDWSQQCHEHLAIESEDTSDQQSFNLLTPASRCPECGHRITALENIPVISYLALRGQCRDCGTRIPLRYPMIEIITAMRTATDRPILTHVNAGIPRIEQGNIVYPDTPEHMAERMPEMVAAGANIVGGCCGTGPDHVRAIVKMLRG